MNPIYIEDSEKLHSSTKNNDNNKKKNNYDFVDGFLFENKIKYFEIYLGIIFKNPMKRVVTTRAFFRKIINNSITGNGIFFPLSLIISTNL